MDSAGPLSTTDRRSRVLAALGWSAAGVLVVAAVVLVLTAFRGGGGTGVVLALALSVSALVLVTTMGVLARAGITLGRRDALPEGRITMKPLDYLVSLLNVSRAIGAERPASDLYQVIVDSCMDCFECEEASIMMLDRATNDLVVTAFAGHRDAAVVRKARVKMGQGVAGTVAQNRTPLVLGPQIEAKRFPGFQQKQRRIHCSMVAPILVRSRVVGVLNVSTGNEAITFSDDDLRVLCILAEHAGIVVAKVQDHARVIRLIRRIRRRSRSSGSGSAVGASDQRAA